MQTDCFSASGKLLQDRLKMNEGFRVFLAPGQYEGGRRAFYLRFTDLAEAKV